MYWTALLLAAVPLTAALPTYTLPMTFTKALAADASCQYPEAFRIRNFQAWTPAQGNNASVTVRFGYADNSTGIQTSCQYNSTSANVGSPGLTPRYACDDPLAEFIWNNGTLTMIEAACPGQTGARKFEASGTAKLQTQCTNTDSGSGPGDGTQCLATDKDLQGRFTSLQPSPQ